MVGEFLQAIEAETDRLLERAGAAKPLREAKPFTHRDYDIYLVTRLDAYTVDEAMALVGKAKEAWFVRGVNLPFITTSIREQATDSIETFLSLARQCLAEKF